jgi:hypothetical protein
MDSPHSGQTGLVALLDLANRRLEWQDRTFDGLTARAAAVFGFTTFALPVCVWVLKRLSPFPRAQVAFGLALLGCYAAMAFFCWRAYRIAQVAVWPKVTAMYGQSLHLKPLTEAQDALLNEVASAYRENEPVVARKAEDISKAIAFLGLELAAIIVGTLWPVLHRFLCQAG